LLSTAVAVSAGFIATSSAYANGRFPAASQLTFDPNDARHMVLSTTFGLLESRDGGTTFDYRCEFALGITGEQDTMTAITANGTTVAATFTGMLTTIDGCTYRAPPELADKILPDLTWSRSTPHELMAFHEIGVSEGKYDSQVVRSNDDGQTWSNVGPALPQELLPVTIDIAPSDRRRIYLSALLGKADAFASVLMRSDDAGETFVQAIVPESTPFRLTYIAAVHPHDVDRVYVRVDGSPATVIWSSDDGGQNFRKLFTGAGRLLGFAISPDGNEIAFGGPDDGLWVGASEGTTFERQSDVGPLCLTWTTDALFACADVKASGFSLGRSRDRGTTFESMLRFDELCGVTGCDRSTKVGMTCPEDWQQLAPRLDTMCGVPDAGLSSSTPDASGDAPTDADGSPGASVPPFELSGGCALARPASAHGAWGWAWLLWALAVRDRRRNSAQH
jgi:hypothetical protein